MKLKRTLGIPLTNEVDWWRHQTDRVALSENDF